MRQSPITTNPLSRRLGVYASVAGLAALLAVPLAAPAAPRSAHAAAQCGPGNFTADIRSGPDRDLSVTGKLSITLASSGRITGALVHYGKRLPVTGKAKGRTFRLAVHLRSGRTMRGIGTGSGTISTCADIPRAGTATGPRRGDSGVWGYALGG